MKKVFILIMAIVLIMALTTSHAANLDLSGYSNEELVEISRLINQEIVDRKIEKSAHLSGGVYVAGIDIPIGEYLVVVDNTNGSSQVPIRFLSRNAILNSIYGNLQPGCVYQQYFTLEQNDELSVGIDFDLVIKPRGMIQFK